MAVSSYIADNDNNNKVYFDLDPTPVPFVRYEIAQAKKRTLNSRDGSGNITPGTWHHYAGGGDISGATIEANVIKMTKPTYSSIVTKMLRADSVIFSPDDGTTKYECTFTAGSQPEAIEGTDLLRWNIVFDIIQIVA